MRKDRWELFAAIFASALVLSNLLSAKLIAIGPLVVPGGVVCYAITYLMCDVIGERYGREQAERTVRNGMLCQGICTALVMLTCVLPSVDAVSGKAFDGVFALNVWLTVASLIAYMVSQSLDVALFHGIREWLISKGKRYKWIWNNFSTLVSQAVDTVIYVAIAFGVGMNFPIAVLGQMVLSQIIVKAVLAVADTPLFYIMTKERGMKWQQL